MPLFQRQTSKKNKKGKRGSVDVCETVTNEEGMSVLTEVNSMLSELIDNVSRKTDISEENIDIPTADLPTDASNVNEEGPSMRKNDDSSEDDKNNVTVARNKKITKKGTRSASECGSGIESQTKIIRRKYGSEAEVLSIKPPQETKELNEAIGNYIDKLIKNSMYETVRNINVDSLCKDTSNDFTNCQNPQSTESEDDFAVEQRLKSNSISELVELDNVNNTTNEINDVSNDTFISSSDKKVSEYELVENEVDDIEHVSFGGYLADDDTTSIDDLKSLDEDSLYSSSCSALESKTIFYNDGSEISEHVSENESAKNTDNGVVEGTVPNEANQHTLEAVKQPEEKLDSEPERNNCEQEKNNSIVDKELEVCETQHDLNASTPEKEQNSMVSSVSQKNLEPDDKFDETVKITSTETTSDDKDQKLPLEETSSKKEQIHPADTFPTSEEISSAAEKSNELNQELPETNNLEEQSLIILEDKSSLPKNVLKTEEDKITPLDVDEGLPQPSISEEERMKINWKVGNLHVKLPHKTRGKTHLKAWKKRRVIIQPDEFVNDPKNQSLVISVYGSDSKKHAFWHSVSSQKATVFRSSSRSHRYAFTISEGGQAVIHLAAESETATQEWMAAVRAILWPPSPFMELEKMLSGQEFDVSIIDNEFTYHAGLLGMYGYLSITPKKLTLLHPQQGYVIQEWYLNTVDKFQFVPQTKEEDMHKVLSMTTCRDSSTGQGTIIFFCKEAVTLLQSLASNIHQVLSYHSKQEGGRYQKELEEIAEWLVAPPQDCLNVEYDEHYKVPPRQVKSLLDIPNFIFNKSLSPVASAIYPAPNTEIMEPLDTSKNKPTNISQDSGISTCTSSDDFLNCSVASFIIGGGPLTGKSSDSELSDTYTPPRTPEMKKKIQCGVVKEQISAPET